MAQGLDDGLCEVRGRFDDVRRAAYRRLMDARQPVDVTPPQRAVEPCPRCAADMEWRHGTFQCPRCRFKVGCCEGLTGDCRTT